MDLNEFLNKYKDQYPQPAVEYIVNNFGKVLPLNNPDILNQVYDALGMFKDRNPYLAYLKLLEQHFDISSNILEIGGGFYPAFATHVRDRQLQTKKGTITVYDKMLVTQDLPHMKLVKQDFKIQDSVSPYDLLVGILPCDATTLIIKKANEENKNFFIVLCNCTHFSRQYLMFNRPTLENWRKYIKEVFDSTKKDNEEMLVLDSPTKYTDYKVLIKKQKN